MDSKHLKNFDISKHVHVENPPQKRLSLLLGDCQAMRDVRQLLDEIADFDAAVLVTGEAGTGKAMLARTLHQKSQRREHAFVRLNCAAMPPGLLDSALFGLANSALRDSSNSVSGALVAAEKGTLFLAAIDAVPLETQSKLLHLLQTGEYASRGGSESHNADVRIIAATSKNLAESVQKGAFRQDLFYRLNLIEVILPPLRERGEDILLLAGHFLQRDAACFEAPATQLSEAAIEFLQHYRFPGNVRELQKLVRRAFILADGQSIEPHHLQPRPYDHAQAAEQTIHFNTAKQQVVDAFEKAFLSQRLHETGGNISKAARLCGMYKANFIQKMKKHGLRRRDFLKK